MPIEMKQRINLSQDSKEYKSVQQFLSDAYSDRQTKIVSWLFGIYIISSITPDVSFRKIFNIQKRPVTVLL